MSHQIYQQIEKAILEDLSGQSRPKGWRLPSEAELCRQYSCSRQTVRKALASLTEKGIIASRQGFGSFLTRPILSHPSKDISVLLPSISGFVYPSVLKGAESVLTPLGYRVSVYQIESERDELSVLQRLIEDPPAGIIKTNDQPFTPFPDYYRRLRELGVPLVFAENGVMNFSDCTRVTMDHFSCGETAARILAEAGCTHPTNLVPRINLAHTARHAGFLCGLSRLNLPISEFSGVRFASDHDSYARIAPISPESIPLYSRQRIEAALKQADGVLVGDYHIHYVLSVLEKLGRVPGRDLSVISVSDSPFLETISQPISSLAHAKEKMGITAANAVLRLLEGEENREYRLPFELIDRGSIFCPSAGE